LKHIWLLVSFFIPVSSVAGQLTVAGLPKDAHIIERRPLSIVGYPGRELVLWMLHPERTPSFYSRGEGDYTCPEYSRGSFLSGPLRVSLMDTRNSKVVNTIEVINAFGEDSFDIPYAILKNDFYRTAAESEDKESKPIVIWLRDFTGTGKPLQFALYDKPACSGLLTALIGYEPEEDRVQHYEAVLRISSERKTQSETLKWVDGLVSEKPVARGHWKYEMDYGGWCHVDKYDVRFVPSRHRFEGTLNLISLPDCK
jgi:hypothetical protein